MKTDKVTVKQVHYDDFSDHAAISHATMTEWYNGDGMDVFIKRGNMPYINVSLTWEDITLLRRMFVDFEASETM